jgi:hypothetical protein
MAQTDARAGFRLPWSSERPTSETTDFEQADAIEARELDTDTETDWHATDEARVAEVARDDVADAPDDAGASSAPATPPSGRPAGRKSSKFLADLTKAMQAAAEESRALAVAQFEVEAKAYIEEIRNRSSGVAAGLRRAADDDVQAVREWSKAEIARIREETEIRITARKGQLEQEIEGHTARIEREVAQVQGRVTAFEGEMATFFERLLSEDDPTRFATMAERLPEPPTFEEMSASTDYSTPLEVGPEADSAEVVEDQVESVGEAIADGEPAEAALATDTDTDTDTTHADAEAEAEASTDGEPTEESLESATGNTGDGMGFEIDRESAFAAIQAAAEAAASAEVAADAAARAEDVANIAIEIVGSHEDDYQEADSRATALGLTPDFAAAEAEAFASADANDEGEEIPEIGDEALAARLAGLTPSASDKSKASDSTATQVVVTGLVSVASIASFKRHLGRLHGVHSVGVSSGPDGEFLFAVHHGTEVVLRDAIAAMPSFQARVTGSGEGSLTVSAHDPESDN